MPDCDSDAVFCSSDLLSCSHFGRRQTENPLIPLCSFTEPLLPRWTRDEIRRFRASQSSLAALFFRHGGRIDRPSGECRLNHSHLPNAEQLPQSSATRARESRKNSRGRPHGGGRSKTKKRINTGGTVTANANAQQATTPIRNPTKRGRNTFATTP